MKQISQPIQKPKTRDIRAKARQGTRNDLKRNIVKQISQSEPAPKTRNIQEQIPESEPAPKTSTD